MRIVGALDRGEVEVDSRVVVATGSWSGASCNRLALEIPRRGVMEDKALIP